MKKETLEYLMGSKNAVRDEFIISREKSGAAELVHISHPEIEEPLYELWHTSKRKKGVFRKGDKGEMVKPKHTGGKKPYVILLKEFTNELSLEASGLLLKLMQGGCVEWHTSRLIRKRDKAALTQAMMQSQFNIGAKKLKRLLNELTAKNILTYNKPSRAYFIDRRLVKKGGVLRENQVREGVHPGENSGTPGVVHSGEQPHSWLGKCLSAALRREHEAY